MNSPEKYRPRLHFSPAKGWQNDPNGMIVLDGVYHLFFQHDPDSTVHGPMHWGHARSDDLVHWTELPIALYPTELGTCFSGSAIETQEGEVRLFYTAHRRIDGEDFQTQALVYANRALDSFEREPGNPIINNPGLRAFRDPKVVWHEPTQRWIMLVTHGQCIGFYGSQNLVDWTLLSTFGETEGRHGPGPWECPDMICLKTPGGESKWVVLVGVQAPAYANGSGTQYFVGDFDGTRFQNDNPPECELWLDFGRDHYATQTFFDRSGGETIAMSWASNIGYAQQTPTTAFRGAMTLPRVLSLIDTSAGLRISARLPDTVARQVPDGITNGVGYVQLPQNLAIGEATRIILFGAADAQIVVRRSTATSGSIRMRRDAIEGIRDFGHDYEVPVSWPSNGPLELTLFVDRGMVEIAAADGTVWITSLYFPADPEGEMRFERTSKTASAKV